MSHGSDDAADAAGVPAGVPRANSASARAIRARAIGRARHRLAETTDMELPPFEEAIRPGEGSAGGEGLVGAGRALALPLVQLLAQGAAVPVDVQAQAAVAVLELIGAVGLLDRLPHAA